MKNSSRVWANIITLVIVLTVNYLANALPINNQTTGAVSDKYPVLFTPPSYVFSIWGLIYLLLIGFTIYQALPGQSDNKHIASTGYFFALSSVFNTLWIFAWHYDQLLLSTILIIGVLVSLTMLYIRLRSINGQLTIADRLLVRLPFSIYFGWASVATIANITILLYALGWDGWGISPVVWTVIMIFVGTALALYNSFKNHDIAYVLVFVWAFTGIAIGSVNISPLNSGAWIASILLAIAVLYSLARNLKEKTA